MRRQLSYMAWSCHPQPEVGPEFELTNGLLHALDKFFIDGGDTIDDAGNGGDGNIRPLRNIGYADSFFGHVEGFNG